MAFMQGHRGDFEPFLEEDEEWAHYVQRMSRVRRLNTHKQAVATTLQVAVLPMGPCQPGPHEVKALSPCASPCARSQRQGGCLQEGTWAGQQELVALARDLRLRLRVYQAGQPSWVLAPDSPDFPKAWPQPARGTHAFCLCLSAACTCVLARRGRCLE